jgi:asparagine synthase (glutamine-hydrolysing)
MRRLAIVDLESTQPVFNEDKSIVVVMNGEIYNYPELQLDLDKRGHRFRYDHSDTELVPHLYEEYGVEWVNHVNGMFAVAEKALLV